MDNIEKVNCNNMEYTKQNHQGQKGVLNNTQNMSNLLKNANY